MIGVAGSAEWRVVVVVNGEWFLVFEAFGLNFNAIRDSIRFVGGSKVHIKNEQNKTKQNETKRNEMQ